jgi:hypothetical protein
MPAPVTIEPDPTTRLTPIPVEPTTPAPTDETTRLPLQPQPPDVGGDATQVVPLPAAEDSEPPTQEQKSGA